MGGVLGAVEPTGEGAATPGKGLKPWPSLLLIGVAGCFALCAEISLCASGMDFSLGPERGNPPFRITWWLGGGLPEISLCCGSPVLRSIGLEDMWEISGRRCLGPCVIAIHFVDKH